MINAADSPKILWSEAVMHAIWLKNCTCICRLGKRTPYKMLYKAKPSLANIPAWGYPMKVHTTSGSKLDGWAQDSF